MLGGTSWATRLTREPQILRDALLHVTVLGLTINDKMLDYPIQWPPGPANNEPWLSSGPRWATFLQSAMNLPCLRLTTSSEMPGGFDNMLHHVITTCSWPALSELVLSRESNIKLLPYTPGLFDHSSSWYLFLQRDLDAFLLKHKRTLQLLALCNVIDLTGRAALPDLAQPMAVRDDPAPSLPPFDNSLRLWARELKKSFATQVCLSSNEWPSLRRCSTSTLKGGSRIAEYKHLRRRITSRWRSSMITTLILLSCPTWFRWFYSTLSTSSEASLEVNEIPASSHSCDSLRVCV